MIRRISRRNYNIYAFDIETHNDDETIAKRETSMWLGYLIDEKSEVNDKDAYFYTMEEFLIRLETLANPKIIHGKRPCKNLCIYVFNLSFEWSFLLPVLLKLGFKYKEEIDWDNDEYCYNSVSTKSCSSVWSISLKLNKKSGRIIFRDLSKLYPGSLRSVAKAFDLPTQKGEIDYRLNRLHDYKVTAQEREYCFKDVKIIMDILEKVGDDKFFWSASSSASYSVKTGLKFAFPTSLKPYKEFRKLYPELGQEESDFLRKGVGGGITYAPERYQFKNIKNKLIHIDLHQAHPSSLALKYFPYGAGEYFKGKPPVGFGINACRILIGYSGVKLHCIISLIGLPFVENRELVVWDFEIPLMKECYIGLTIKYIDGYHYKAKPSPFGKYMRVNYSKRLEAKKNGDKYNTMRFKLLNNSFYGKLLERPHNVSFENVVNADGVITSEVHDKEDKEVSGHFAYIPLGSCIPAYTRGTLVSTALKFGYKNIVYFDTDSIFMLDNEETREVLKTINLKDELGGWGIEDEEGITESQFTAPKRYKLKVGDKLVVRAGGINFNEFVKEKGFTDLGDVPFEELNITDSSWKIQRAYRVKGGTIICFQEKKMSVQSKYVDIYNRNKEE